MSALKDMQSHENDTQKYLLESIKKIAAPIGISMYEEYDKPRVIKIHLHNHLFLHV